MCGWSSTRVRTFSHKLQRHQMWRTMIETSFRLALHIVSEASSVYSPDTKDQMILTLRALPSTQIQKDQVAPL